MREGVKQLPVRGALVDLRQWLPIPSAMGERARVVTSAGTLVIRLR